MILPVYKIKIQSVQTFKRYCTVSGVIFCPLIRPPTSYLICKVSSALNCDQIKVNEKLSEAEITWTKSVCSNEDKLDDYKFWMKQEKLFI